jgi:hypothetical protein
MSGSIAKHGWKLGLGLGIGLVLTAAPGCSPQNPNAVGIETPIVTSDAPRTSEEAARQSEPEPIQYKTKRPR